MINVNIKPNFKKENGEFVWDKEKNSQEADETISYLRDYKAQNKKVRNGDFVDHSTEFNWHTITRG